MHERVYFQEIILPVTCFIMYGQFDEVRYMKGGRIIIRKPKMDLSGLSSTIPDNISHSNCEI
jgi:hypothetical protein